MTATYTLVTGASRGLGRELALEFARHNHDLVLVARDQSDLENVQKEIEQIGRRAVCVTLDLTTPGAAKQLYNFLKDQNIQIDTLVNNAGFGINGPFLNTNWQQQYNLLQLNIMTLTELTYIFGGDMKQAERGRVLNVASTAAFSAGPNMALYYASKAFVLSFSEAIAEELRDSGVTVTALCPGPTTTNFENTAKMTHSVMFQTLPQSPAAVARAGYAACMRGRTIKYHGPVTLAHVALSRLLPRAIVRRMAQLMNKVD